MPRKRKNNFKNFHARRATQMQQLAESVSCKEDHEMSPENQHNILEAVSTPDSASSAKRPRGRPRKDANRAMSPSGATQLSRASSPANSAEPSDATKSKFPDHLTLSTF